MIQVKLERQARPHSLSNIFQIEESCVLKICFDMSFGIITEEILVRSERANMGPIVIPKTVPKHNMC